LAATQLTSILQANGGRLCWGGRQKNRNRGAINRTNGRPSERREHIETRKGERERGKSEARIARKTFAISPLTRLRGCLQHQLDTKGGRNRKTKTHTKRTKARECVDELGVRETKALVPAHRGKVLQVHNKRSLSEKNSQRERGGAQGKKRNKKRRQWGGSQTITLP